MKIILFKLVFRIGYFVVQKTTLIPVTGELSKINIGRNAFHKRLVHLLHLLVYFLICIYFLGGINKGLTLFEKNSLIKFVLVILYLATVTEVVHHWVPERSFNPVDWMSNVAGILVGLMVIIVSGKTKRLMV